MDLLVLAKAPIPGRVKTRLCPPCTPAQAAAVAEAALADTLDAATASGAGRVVVALDGAPGPWCPPGVVVVAQGDGPLSARLARCWSAATGPALQIGMDTPQLTAHDLDAALGEAADGQADAVLGPATDGGWWAVGMRRPRPSAFLGVPTSRADTGRRQLAALRRLGLAVRLLEPRRDVDTWDDAVAVAAAVTPGRGRFAAAVAAVDAVGTRAVAAPAPVA